MHFLNYFKLGMGDRILLREIGKIDQNQFLKECQLTFDSVHCSDFADGEKEISMFFWDREIKFKKLTAAERAEILLPVLAAR